MIRMSLFTLFAMLSILACDVHVYQGESDYQEDWFGTWYDASTGFEITFHDNGYWSALVVREGVRDDNDGTRVEIDVVGIRVEIDDDGVRIEVDRMGSYSIDEDSYRLTIFSNNLLGIDGEIDTGTWKRRRNKLELISDYGEMTVLRKI